MLTNVSEVHIASIIALMMEVVRTSDTSVNINFTTQRHIPEDSKLHTRCHGNLKSYISLNVHMKTERGSGWDYSCNT
jgi:hypothetical protein